MKKTFKAAAIGLALFDAAPVVAEEPWNWMGYSAAKVDGKLFGTTSEIAFTDIAADEKARIYFTIKNRQL